ncbi:hypothetical protein DIPPA_03188 [Diplonema papillatum]|nr:hypothetical protein DIPPA_03188 [Diplonema papillatum]
MSVSQLFADLRLSPADGLGCMLDQMGIVGGQELLGMDIERLRDDGLLSDRACRRLARYILRNGRQYPPGPLLEESDDEKKVTEPACIDTLMESIQQLPVEQKLDVILLENSQLKQEMQQLSATVTSIETMLRQLLLRPNSASVPPPPQATGRLPQNLPQCNGGGTQGFIVSPERPAIARERRPSASVLPSMPPSAGLYSVSSSTVNSHGHSSTGTIPPSFPQGDTTGPPPPEHNTEQDRQGSLALMMYQNHLSSQREAPATLRSDPVGAGLGLAMDQVHASLLPGHSNPSYASNLQQNQPAATHHQDEDWRRRLVFENAEFPSNDDPPTVPGSKDADGFGASARGRSSSIRAGVVREFEIEAEQQRWVNAGRLKKMEQHIVQQQREVDEWARQVGSIVLRKHARGNEAKAMDSFVQHTASHFESPQLP